MKDKSKIDEHRFLNKWKHVVHDRTFTAARMNELLDMAQNRRIYDDMNATQILLNVNKLLKPYEKCLRSYRRKAYNITQLNEFDALIQRKNKQDLYYKDSMNILNQKVKIKQEVEYDTSAVDEIIL